MFAFDPAVIVWLVLAEGLYLRAVSVLRRRGRRTARGQQAAFHVGVGCVAVGMLGPPGALAGSLLTAHMVEHLLLADIAAPLLLVGLRTPLLQFFLPRDALVPLARARRLRWVFRQLRRPLIAGPLYVATLYGWHVGPLFEAAVHNPWVHAAQHATFVAGAMLVWWPALEPNRARMPGELWKVPYMLGARFASMMIGMNFVLIRHAFYVGAYGAGQRGYGLDAIGDQQLAGAIMVTVDIAIMIWALSFFFYRAATDDMRRNEPLAVGGTPATEP